MIHKFAEAYFRKITAFKYDSIIKVSKETKHKDPAIAYCPN